MKVSQLVKAVSLLALGAVSTMAAAESKVSWEEMIPYSRALSSVSSVTNALENGAQVNATVDLSQCARQGGGATSETKGGLVVSPFRIQGNGMLSFSDSHFTVSSRTNSPIMQFLRYQVAPEGGITVTSYIYTVPDYSLLSQSAFDCQINEGVNFYAAY
ncbi:VirK family protein [Vibrio mangrovi]|uniref:VirK family protein n=1 Tax=Vibrio mangrovi TaxID=474394 RepID=A0A1Y6IPY3_9VIBR|nr:VirK family protein [Vibrio mangrovi]MDW6004071.1 VirK family protein [Vibrio mangrovi]SMR99131.1 VirK protein [Vibrio mangrovi]